MYNNKTSLDTSIISEDGRIVNIRVCQQLTSAEIHASRLTSSLEDNAILNTDLFAAYNHYMDRCQYIRRRSIKHYRYMRYTLLDDNGEFYAHIKLHIGDVVIIKEEEDESYAIIKAIFTHKYNNDSVYGFVWIDWLKNTEHTDGLLRCLIFERQRESDTRWHRIYPISILNEIPKVHFVHACRPSCSADTHDNANIQYYMNQYFYKTV